MKKFVNLKIILAVLLCVFVFDVSAEAQRRRRSTPAKKPVATKKTSSTSTAASLAARNAAILPATEKVGNQIKNLTQFIFLMGNSVSAIEVLDKEVQSGKAPQSVKTRADAGRKGLISTITIFKNAMADLEDQFRASPVLKPYLAQIVGVSDYAATAEQQAAAGNFNQAGRTLLLVVNQLTDVLREMP